MCDNANAHQEEQLDFFGMLEETPELEPLESCDGLLTLYVHFEGRDIVAYLDRECTEYFSLCEDSRVARRIWKKDTVTISNEKYITTYKVVWV